METVALLVFITVFPAIVQASCADIDSCPTEFYSQNGMDCKKLDVYIKCLKAAQCQEVAGTIESLGKNYQSTCNSSNPVKNEGSQILSILGSMDTSSYVSMGSCSMLAQCGQATNVADMDMSRLSNGDFSQMCQMLKPIIECWTRARASCSLPANLTAMMDKSKAMVDMVCGGKDEFADMMSKMLSESGMGFEGCQEFIKCYAKGLPTKNGQIDMSAMQRIGEDIPAMCRLYGTMFSCTEHADSKCQMVTQILSSMNTAKDQMKTKCGKYWDSGTAGSLTTWTLLVWVLAAFVVILHN